jgi:uncharacterized HAD superfamily protein
MSKEVLAFDMDGVLYPWQEQFLRHLQVIHGYTGDMRDLFCEGRFFCSQSELWQDNMICTEFLYSQRPPLRETIELLNRLAEKFEIMYITSRPEDVRNTTEHYLKTYKFPCNESLIMSRDKVTEIRMAAPDYYVEDRGDIAVAIDNFTKVFLFAQPWNEQYRDKFEVINNLVELESKLLGEENCKA